MFAGHRPPRRQVWDLTTLASSTTESLCTPFALPSQGYLTIDSTTVLTITQTAFFQPECSGGVPATSLGGDTYHPSDALVDFKNPFYRSTPPQVYALAVTTVLSYILVIILLITPQTYFVGSVGGAGALLGRQRLSSRALWGPSVVGVGGRPLLQKVATFLVAISLTIASANTFKHSKEQHDAGYQDADALAAEVVGGLEIRILSVVSNFFLWLAQVQTLIRLFPRQKEKVIIKWTGFALILLDTVFSILDSFLDNEDRRRPREFIDAIPALSYLFQLALSLLYAAWVIYYALSKHRFAFFHTKMRNICLVAILSLTAVLIPVVFFVLDISKPDVSGWGDYVRWVGAAAASVVVWEWVERIETMERDERKDGILGREVFDGDEMLDVTPSELVNWPGSHGDSGRRRRPGGDGFGSSSSWAQMGNVSSRISPVRVPRRSGYRSQAQGDENGSAGHRSAAFSSAGRSALTLHNQQTIRPPIIASPVSRTDTTSAASTVYAVHYHTIDTSASPVPERCDIPTDLDEIHVEAEAGGGEMEHVRHLKHLPQPQLRNSLRSTSPESVGTEAGNDLQNSSATDRWPNLPNPFKRRRTLPPSVVANATTGSVTPQPNDDFQRQSMVRPTINALNRLRQLRVRRKSNAPEVSMPVIVIPAPARGRVWSPPISGHSPPPTARQIDDSGIDRPDEAPEPQSSAVEGIQTFSIPSSPQSAARPDKFTQRPFSQRTNTTTGEERSRWDSRVQHLSPISSHDDVAEATETTSRRTSYAASEIDSPPATSNALERARDIPSGEANPQSQATAASGTPSRD